MKLIYISDVRSGGKKVDLFVGRKFIPPRPPSPHVLLGRTCKRPKSSGINMLRGSYGKDFFFCKFLNCNDSVGPSRHDFCELLCTRVIDFNTFFIHKKSYSKESCFYGWVVLLLKKIGKLTAGFVLVFFFNSLQQPQSKKGNKFETQLMR